MAVFKTSYVEPDLITNEVELTRLKASRSLETPIVVAKLRPDVLERYGPGRSNDNAIVFVDRSVWALWRTKLLGVFDTAYKTTTFRILDGGEACKSFETLANVLRQFNELGIDRRCDSLFAVGGGAMLDLLGFAASMYRRGISITKIPTTVMAQVDAAVGLKNAVNFDGVKNLVGSFYPPHSTLIDTEFLNSLDRRHVSNGLAEVIKIAVVLDKDLLDAIDALPTHETNSRAHERVYVRAIELMVDELNSNPYDAQLRRSVDFGHWLSPYIELQDTDLLHGEAVSIDVANAMMIAARRKLISEADMLRPVEQLQRLGLPICHALVSAENVEKAIQGTKKSRGGQQNIPLCTGLGTHEFFGDLEVEEVVHANLELTRMSGAAHHPVRKMNGVA